MDQQAAFILGTKNMDDIICRIDKHQLCILGLALDHFTEHCEDLGQWVSEPNMTKDMRDKINAMILELGIQIEDFYRT